MDCDCEASARNILDDILHNSAAPTYLPFSLLQDITNDFSDDHRIGSGGFATVYKGQLWSGSVAVKKLDANRIHMDEQKFTNEVECMMTVKHKNIVRFLGYCSEAHGRMEKCQGKSVIAEKLQRLLCLEYLPNGSLDAHINASSGSLKWTERSQIIKGICEGLYHLHQKSILHLDLKPANILLDYNMEPKIADFGLARWFGENQMPVDDTEKIVGTLGGIYFIRSDPVHFSAIHRKSRGYMAPEYINTGAMTDKSDIFSLGVMIMEILTGKKERCKVDNHQHVACACVLESWKSRLESASADMALGQIIEFANISMACMDPDPVNRPSVQDILEKLDEMETSDGFDQNNESSMLLEQGIPHPGELLNVKPLELRFVAQVGNFIPCTVSLTNKTDQHVAFRLMPSDGRRKSCSLEHLAYGGVVPPRSTCRLNLRTHEIQKALSWNEEYLLKSRIMGNVLDFKDLRGQVHEVIMRALYVLETIPLTKILIKVAITRKSCKTDFLWIISKVKGIKSLRFDDDKSLLIVVGNVNVVEVVAALRKAKHPAEVMSVTSIDGEGKDVTGPSRA